MTYFKKHAVIYCACCDDSEYADAVENAKTWIKENGYTKDTVRLSRHEYFDKEKLNLVVVRLK